jgi:hypothetical protein
MRKQLFVDTGFRCAQSGCNGTMGRDECGIFCTRCGFEASTWADPVDADVPMNVLLQRERREVWKRRAILGAGAASLLAMIGLGGKWFLQREPAATLREISSLSYSELRAGFASGAVPRDWNVPAYYRNAERFLMPSERSAQSVLGPIWQALEKEQKLEILVLVKTARSVELLGPMLDIAWHVLPTEADFDLARSMLDGLYLSTGNIAEAGIFVCEHVAQTTPLPVVRTRAQDYVDALRERLSRLGR